MTYAPKYLAPSLTALALAAFASPALAQTAALQSLEVSPPEINLLTARGKQVFVVQARFADGITQDVTAAAKASLVNPALAKVEKNVVTPLADGATEMKVEHGGKTVVVPVKVKDAKAD